MERPASGIPIDSRSLVKLLSRLRSAQGQSDPYPFYSELRSLGDVIPAPWGGYLLTSYNVCDQVLRDKSWLTLDVSWREQQESRRWSTFGAQELSHTVQAMNPPIHSIHRRSIGNPFNQSILAEIERSTKRTASRLVTQLRNRIIENGEADFTELVGERLPVETIGHWLGLPRKDHALLRDLTHGIAYAQELLPNYSQMAVADNAAHGLREYFTALVQRRRDYPDGSVISGWIRTWDEMEPDRQKANMAVYYLAMFVVIASLETTSTLLSSAVRLLSEHSILPGDLKEPNILSRVADEVIRYDPPIHITTRVALEDRDLSGTRIPAGKTVHVMVASANHDNDKGSDVIPFATDALYRKQLSFGGGIHYCLGANLAKMELQILLQELNKKIPNLKVSSPPVWEPRLAFRRLVELKVTGA